MDEATMATRATARPVERASPHSDEAEISVLGAMLIEETAADRAMETLIEEDFHHPAHRHIFRAIASVRDQGHAPDALAVREELRRLSVLDEAGGDEYLARIVDIVPTAANLPYHARIVQDLAVKRRLIRAGTEIVAEAYASADDSDHLLNRAEERIFRLSEHRFKRSFTPIGQLLQGAVMQLETLSARREAITGAPTGFKDLDEMTAGFQLSDLIIVAGRPSMGKCVSHDTEIVLDDGSVTTIEVIPRAPSPSAPAYSRSARRSATTRARNSVEVLMPAKAGSSSRLR
jgi:replicative DNA helicase